MSLFLYLQNHHLVKGKELAEKFDVSLRTVYRDIRSLENAGIPIYGEAGVGFSLVEGNKVPPIRLEEKEAIAFMVAEKIITGMVDSKTSQDYLKGIEKIRGALGERVRDLMSIVDDSIQLISHQRQGKDHPFLGTLISTIASKRVITVLYQKLNSENAERRTLEPIGCYFRYSSWYLIAYCHLREAYRTFKLDRFQEIIEENQLFDRSVHPSVKEYLARETENKESWVVTVDFDLEMARYTGSTKYAFGWVDEEQISDTKFRMTFVTYSFFGLAQWLLGFTKYVTIVEPPELTDYMTSLIEDLNLHYQKK